MTWSSNDSEEVTAAGQELWEMEHPETQAPLPSWLHLLEMDRDRAGGLPWLNQTGRLRERQ